MRVLMLGWEYPPHISGGLGTACEGLSRSLARLGVEIIFVVPRLLGDEQAPHMTLLDSYFGDEKVTSKPTVLPGLPPIIKGKLPILRPVRAMLAPYWNPSTYLLNLAVLDRWRTSGQLTKEDLNDPWLLNLVSGGLGSAPLRPGHQYGSDIFDEIRRFSANVVKSVAADKFELIHAHDWMTYPAAVTLKDITGKPLILHVHSLEFDRSGHYGNQQIIGIEKFGFERADKIIAVSHYTASVICREHGITPTKISVVHNGVSTKSALAAHLDDNPWAKLKNVVLFLGRVTFQKGPDYFVEAASRVVSVVPDALFVMAGSGDMLPRLMQRVHVLGLSKNFHFPGFLKGEEVEQIFSVAEVYVMPSVSEPFGISALEAINFDTPVILSKQSGVSEVLRHALKVDFWDTDRLSDLIINALLSPELREDMAAMAREEIKNLQWEAAGVKTLDIYKRIVN